jgi:iron complex transport system substrate-binding protein
VKGKGITMTARRFVTPLVTLLLLVVACSAPAATPPEPTAEAPSTVDHPMTITDAAGRTVTVSSAPRRIVSLAPSNTEIVCGLDACDRLVGVPEYLEGYPDEVLATVADLPTVVSFGPVDREAVVALEPDLVLAAGNELTPSDDIAALEELGLTVIVLYPETLEEIHADLELMGNVLDAADEAEALIADLRERTDAVLEAVAGAVQPRTFYEVGLFEGAIYTAGEGSFLASMIELAGGEPIAGDALGNIDAETLVAADPELILLGTASYDPTLGDPDTALDAVASRPGWEGITAVRDGRVVPYHDDIVTTRPGPRIVDGLEALARAMHPDRFD